MKNKAFKIVLALLFMFSLTAFVVAFTNNNVYAEEIVDSLGEEETTDETPSTDEQEATTTEGQQEATSLTEEEKGKLDSIVEWLSTLNKDELFDYLNAAKNWLIAGGIVTVLGFLSAIIGLIAACLKLAREKTKNSDMSEENKKKTLEAYDALEKKLIDGNTQIKTLLLDIFNNMTDEEKKAMEANINDVKTKIEQALAESTNKQE